jgi:hypothetical protein
MGNSKFI